MKTSTKKIIGVGVVVALLIAGGLAVFVASSKSASEQAVKPVPESTVAPALQLGKAFAAVATHVKPAVVSVYSEKTVKFQGPEFPFPFGDEFFRRFFGEQFPTPRNKPREYSVPERGMGSGMILDNQGHILTNYHVVEGVDEIKVQLADKRQFEAEIVSTDAKTDVAVIKIKGNVPKNLPTVQLGDSDALQVGDLVMAVGAPFGLTQTVTTGIISAKGRSDVGIADFEDFLQTDAPINPGNSGGPLVNMRGEVIGMNSAIATSVGQFAGVGFAIPVNMIKTMLPTLIKGGKITRGMLGVVIQDVTQELAQQFHLPEAKGALVSQVNKDSPAEKAGLKTGDVIIRYDGKTIESTRQLRDLVAGTEPGTRTTVEVIRNGKKETMTVTLGKLPGETVASAGQPGEKANELAKLGLQVQTLTPELARENGLEGEKGVLITQVQQGSLASLAGLQAGDLIVEADRRRVASVDELQSIVAKAKDRVLLLVKHKGASVFVVLGLK